MGYTSTLTITSGDLTPAWTRRQWPLRDTIVGTVNLTGDTFPADGSFRVALTDGIDLLTDWTTCTRATSTQLTFSLGLNTTELVNATFAALVASTGATPTADDYQEYWLILKDTVNAETYIKAKARIYWVPYCEGMSNPSAITTTTLGNLSDVTDGASIGALLMKTGSATWGPSGVGTSGQVLTSRGASATPHFASVGTSGALMADGSVPLTAYIDGAEVATPDSPAADHLRYYTEAYKGFSFPSIKDSGGMVRKLLRDSVFVGKNATGSTIALGRIVYAAGSVDDVPSLALAKADSSTTMPAIGVTIEAIADGAFGRVMQVGLLEDVNTNAFTAGDVLYVSAATAGIPTATAPVYPNIAQEIGTILVKSATVGAIQIVSRSKLAILHAASHTDGTDDIRDSTATQKGLATAAQIAKLDGIETTTRVSLGSATGAWSPALTPDALHTATVTATITGITPSGLEIGEGAMWRLRKTGAHAITTTGIKAAWDGALDDVAATDSLAAIVRDATQYLTACQNVV